MLKPLSAFFVDEKRCGVTAFFRTDTPFEGGHYKIVANTENSMDLQSLAKKEIANTRE